MPEIRQRILENMQKFSRAMIGAVLFLPVIGLILALSSVLTNPTLIAETSFLHQLGQMLGDTFWPLFGNLGLLFCVGISYGLAKDKKTEVALVSVMCFIMFLGANHSWLEHTHGLAEKINGEYYGTGQTQLLGFVVVDMGVFLGIILGCTIAWVHNKVSAIELPGALSMYGGAKLTLVAMTPVVIFYAIAFTWIWPFMTHGISALTGFMKNAGVAGVFVYGFFEKFLIPTGLHHFVCVPLPAHPDWRHAERGWSGGLRHPGHIPRLYAPSRPDAGHERRITFFAARDDHYLWPGGRLAGVLPHRETGEESDGEGDSATGDYHLDADRHHRAD